MIKVFLQQKIAKRIQEWGAIYFTHDEKKTTQNKTNRGLKSYLFYISIGLDMFTFKFDCLSNLPNKKLNKGSKCWKYGFLCMFFCKCFIFLCIATRDGESCYKKHNGILWEAFRVCMRMPQKKKWWKIITNVDAYSHDLWHFKCLPTWFQNHNKFSKRLH